MTNAELKERVTELEDQLTTTQNDLTTTRAQLAYAETELSASRTQLTTTQAERDTARSEVQGLRDQLSVVTALAVTPEVAPVLAVEAEADPHAYLKEVMRRFGHKTAYVAPDGGTFYDRAAALKGVQGDESSLTVVTL